MKRYSLKHLHGATFALLISIALTAGCDNQRQNDEPAAGSQAALDLALKAAIDTQIVPGFQALQSEAQILSSDATAFCNNMSTTTLSELQTQWKTLSAQWNQVAIYNLGPLNDDLLLPKIIFIESMRQRGTDYTDTVRSSIVAALSSMDNLNSTYFDNLPFTNTGILALEVLIFESTIGTHSTDLNDIVSDYQSAPRKCEYLQGMAELFNRHASYVIDGWQIEHLDTGKPFKDILLDGELDDGTASVVKLVTVIQEHLDYIKKRKLETVLDAQIADYAYQNIAATLQQIEQLMNGIDDEQYSFFDHMNNSGFSAEVNVVTDNLGIAKQAVSARDRSAAATAIGVLDGNFKREIPDGLQVILGINFSDGD